MQGREVYHPIPKGTHADRMGPKGDPLDSSSGREVPYLYAADRRGQVAVGHTSQSADRPTGADSPGPASERVGLTPYRLDSKGDFVFSPAPVPYPFSRTPHTPETDSDRLPVTH